MNRAKDLPELIVTPDRLAGYKITGSRRPITREEANEIVRLIEAVPGLLLFTADCDDHPAAKVRDIHAKLSGVIP
jgi:hypothetical protein